MTEKRKYKRHNHAFALKIRNRSKQITGSVHVRDVSLGGVYFITNAELKEGVRIDLSFVPPEQISNRFFDLKIRPTGIVKRIDQHPNQQKGVAVEFHMNLNDFIIQKIYKPIKRNSLILCVFLLMNIFFLKFLNFEYFWHCPPVNIYSIIVSFYILSRLLFALFYLPCADNKITPTISVVIPVRNEEKFIGSAIDHIYSCGYPRDKYEVIVINDNSQDATLKELYKIQGKHNNLTVLNFKENVGKRDAMAAGFFQAKNDILVVVDSDSFISSDAMYNIVQDFKNPKVAAVAGHTDVYNAQDNALTKMQTVRYYLAFKIMKTAESIFSSVTCCPGCFSAYRKEYVLPLIEQWRNQKFLGTTCTFGDDRSLTRLLLKRYEIKYNANAVAYTIVPNRYRNFLNQQLRWKKSWCRETLLASTFMWKKNVFMALSFYFGFILPIISPLVAFAAIAYRPVISGQLPFGYLYGVLVVSLIYALYYRVNRPSRLWWYGIYFSFFYLFILTWQNYIAILTVADTKWGTRNKFRENLRG